MSGEEKSSGKENEMLLFEVFTQGRKGAPHVHAGSVHAADAEMAIQNARDVYGRRDELSNFWIIPSEHVIATEVSDAESFFDPADTKPYRHPQFYKVPRGVKNV